MPVPGPSALLSKEGQHFVNLVRRVQVTSVFVQAVGSYWTKPSHSGLEEPLMLIQDRPSEIKIDMVSAGLSRKRIAPYIGLLDLDRQNVAMDARN